MKALVGLIVHNWPLKLAAILLATSLYAGVVVSQNARTWPGRVPIEALNQPASVFILDSLPDVTGIRYLAPVDAANRVTSASFTASVDLGSVDARTTNGFVSVPVVVTATDPRVQVVDYTPQRIQVRVDPLVDATVPVQVERGALPDGLAADDPVVDPTTAVVTGPRTQVTQVAAALARVRIQPAGLDVDQQVDLVPIDARGEQVAQVDITPSTARVRINVTSQSTTRTLPVAPVLRGDVATGYEVTATTADPAVVTVHGEPEALADLTSIPTKPVSIANATKDVVRKVALVPPSGVTLDATSEVSVTVAVDAKQGTRTFSVGVVLDGARADRGYSVSTETVLVTLGGTVAELEGVDARGLVAHVDVTDLVAGTHVVPVTFDAPGRLSLVSISPTSVTVEITEPTPPPTPIPTPTAEPSAGP